MQDPSDEIADWPDDAALAQLAELLGVPLPEAHREGVRVHLEAALAMARLVYAVPLADEALVPATVFRADPEESS